MAEKTTGSITKTSIDLGDDLLQTRTINRIVPKEQLAPPEPTAENPDELIVNAKILFSEALLEEAKKQLRKALILKPGFVDAEKLLKEIQDLEVKQILQSDGKRKRSRLKNKPDASLDEEIDHDRVISTLEEKVGKDDEEIRFFGSKDSLHEFIEGITRETKNATAREKMDLGVAFLEMKLYQAAIRLFDMAAKDDELADSAFTLKAQAMIESSAFFDALMVLDPLVGDPFREAAEKLEWIYLSARAHEGLKKRKKAAEWYRAVTQIDPQYRDAYERLLRCEKSRSSSSAPSSRS